VRKRLPGLEPPGGALSCTRLRVTPLTSWTVRERVRTSGIDELCAAPCHPWHRGISPSMDKSLRRADGTRNVGACLDRGSTDAAA